tara:strand:- start:871 stop:1587 length:717 start_codon:yes stop_codon:yes gene_type:complete
MTYLELVNDLGRRVNETPLTASNFGSATGYYGTAKDAINSAIRTLNQEAFQWPFNFVEALETLTAGTMRYGYPATAKTIDYNSFRIKRSASFGNETIKLKVLDYDEYLSKFIDDEYNTDESIRSVPLYIVRAPGNKYLVHPSPDQAYELVFEYYSLPVDLVSHADVPTTPDAYRHIIVDGAMYHVQTFRNDNESASIAQGKFTKGISDMRTIYINSYDYVRDTRIIQGRGHVTHIGIA